MADLVFSERDLDPQGNPIGHTGSTLEHLYFCDKCKWMFLDFVLTIKKGKK